MKIEINTTEFFTLHGYQDHKYTIDSRWFAGEAVIKTYQLEELMGTKLRALYQRLKGRDLFDLWLGITQLNMDCDKVVDVFNQYNAANKISISRAEFEKNLIPKMNVHEFVGDVKALLSDGIEWNPEHAFDSVMDSLVSKLSGQPWKEKESKILDREKVNIRHQKLNIEIEIGIAIQDIGIKCAPYFVRIYARD